MDVRRLGEVPYGEALRLQYDLLERRVRDEIPDTLLLLSHPHVYTFGRGGKSENLLVSEDDLAAEGIVVERVGRGGDITYHGPGQVVGYPIVKLQRPDIRRFVHGIESALVEALAAFGIEGGREAGMAGVWVGGRKVAAIGVGVRRWVTMHGFALNVSTDLSYFRRIVPCGLVGRQATSMEELLRRPVPIDAAVDAVEKACLEHLS